MIIDSIRNYMRNLKCLDTFNAAIKGALWGRCLN